MCGICCVCSLAPVSGEEQCPFLNMEYVGSHSFLPRRGPDMQKGLMYRLWSGVRALFAGFVLHLRGSLTPQPLASDDGDLLLWNGEIFDGIEVKDDENDTQVLFQRLLKCESEQDILTVVQSIQGPWSLIFWQARREKLWFGRDVFGRRSLLWHLPQDDGVFALSSVPITPWDFQEIPSVGLFCMEVSPSSLESTNLSCGDSTHSPSHTPFNLRLYPWHRATWPGTQEEVLADDVAGKLHMDDNAYISVSLYGNQAVRSWMPVINSDIPGDSCLLSVEGIVSGSGDLVQALVEVEKRGHLAELVLQLEKVLERAVRKRVHNLPYTCHRHTPGNLPGLDAGVHTEKHCDSLARLDIHQPFVRSADSTSHSSNSAVADKHCDSHARVDIRSGIPQPVLDSVKSTTPHSSNSAASENITSPNNSLSAAQIDHQTVVEDMSTNRPSQGQTQVLQVCDGNSLSSPESEREKGSSEERENCSDISAELQATGDSPESCKEQKTRAVRVAILFSGGVDSTVLAALADRVVAPEEAIDLINVAFEQKVPASRTNRKRGNPAQESDTTASQYDVPDRRTGYLALSELNPQRCWNFVEVNVTQEMLRKHRSESVRHLVYPLATVLDDSIGCALWFAAGARGVLGNGPDTGMPYMSTAKVMLCGMGADEQLAGYSRHRGRFQQESWAGLIAEVNMEIHRISARNLGRDDRIIADHGKESRFPFLDEGVVAFLASLPIHHKADLRFPRGVGEKLLLRLLALRLGLPQTSALPKRAIQFGSRIAKLEQSKEKGNQVCQRLTRE